ncbi:MAG: hypothetical protein PUA52_07275 [Lachnospiraceae bacterium]|nr:hypothetical protein [Lachnospiraceae bacterium]
MRELKVEELSYEAFHSFGEYEDLLTSRESGFYPDMIRLCNDGRDTSVSISRVEGKGREIVNYEYHTNTCEGILPLDGDIYIYAAPPFWFPQVDKMRVFRVPKGTFVRLKAGTLHGGQFSVTGEPVNVLILLPERTYSNDCEFIDLEEKDRMLITE